MRGTEIAIANDGAFDDRLRGDNDDNILEGGLGSDILTGGDYGNDVFVMTINGGDVDTITKFSTSSFNPKKIRLDVNDPSSITDLSSLYAELNITVSEMDYNSDGKIDEVITFAGQNGASDYIIVLDVADHISLSFTDFEIV